MPRPRRRKPTFDTPVVSPPIDTTWVYRSDPQPPRRGPRPGVATPLSGVEQAVDWLSRPFGVAIVLGLGLFGGRRRKGRLDYRRPPAAGS